MLRRLEMFLKVGGIGRRVVTALASLVHYGITRYTFFK